MTTEEKTLPKTKRLRPKRPRHESAPSPSLRTLARKGYTLTLLPPAKRGGR